MMFAFGSPDWSAVGTVAAAAISVVLALVAYHRFVGRAAVGDAESARKLDAVYRWFEEPGPADSFIPLPAQLRTLRHSVDAQSDRLDRHLREEEAAARSAAERERVRDKRIERIFAHLGLEED